MLGGNVTATQGEIGAVAAGASLDGFTAAGVMSGITISGDAGVGCVTVTAAPGFTANGGMMSNVTIRSANGGIGDITATSGISGTIEASGANGSVGNITTTSGNISGNITSTHGNIGSIAAGNGTTADGGISGNITASNAHHAMSRL